MFPSFAPTLPPLPRARPRRRAHSARRPARARTPLRSARMCGSSAPQPARDPAHGENVLHPSWRIYSQPGNPCVLCLGRGVVKCLFCFGDGVIRIGPEDARDTLDCPQCRGSGTATCIRCDGSGLRPPTREDPVTGEILRNPTNEEINRPKLQDQEDTLGEEGFVREGGSVAEGHDVQHVA